MLNFLITDLRPSSFTNKTVRGGLLLRWKATLFSFPGRSIIWFFFLSFLFYSLSWPYSGLHIGYNRSTFLPFSFFIPFYTWQLCLCLNLNGDALFYFLNGHRSWERREKKWRREPFSGLFFLLLGSVLPLSRKRRHFAGGNIRFSPP